MLVFTGKTYIMFQYFITVFFVDIYQKRLTLSTFVDILIIQVHILVLVAFMQLLSFVKAGPLAALQCTYF